MLNIKNKLVHVHVQYHAHGTDYSKYFKCLFLQKKVLQIHDLYRTYVQTVLT